MINRDRINKGITINEVVAEEIYKLFTQCYTENLLKTKTFVGSSFENTYDEYIIRRVIYSFYGIKVIGKNAIVINILAEAKLDDITIKREIESLKLDLIRGIDAYEFYDEDEKLLIETVISKLKERYF